MFDDDYTPSPQRVLSAIEGDPAFHKKYELEHQLGEGASGVVFCARHRELDERVAIKFLKAGSENAEAVARFRREARAAHRVRSEHVVRIIDVTTTQGGLPYVVMEYLEGSDLERMLLESPGAQLPVRDAIDFALQACDAVAECHSIGIVHRDLKPSNLFCIQGADGLPIIKVLDFGISKLGSVPGDEAKTGRNEIMGSPPYMSPEQFASPLEVDQRADIWALGVILYELVTGKKPFAARSIIATWESVKRDAPMPIEQLRRDAPRALGSVVLRCLEKERADRFQTVAELAKALLPLASERTRSTVARIVRILEAPGVTTESLSLLPSRRSSTTLVSASSGSAAARSSPRARTLVWAGTAVLLGIGVLAAWRAGVVPNGPIARDASAREPTGPAPPAETRPAPPAETLIPAEPSAPVPEPARSVHDTSTQLANSATARVSGNQARLPKVEVHPAERAERGSAGTGSNVAPAHSAGIVVARAPSPPAAAASGLGDGETTASKATPWIVDIVEQRKGKPGGPP
jgi:serine/threonine protein kinase